MQLALRKILKLAHVFAGFILEQIQFGYFRYFYHFINLLSSLLPHFETWIAGSLEIYSSTKSICLTRHDEISPHSHSGPPPFFIPSVLSIPFRILRSLYADSIDIFLPILILTPDPKNIFQDIFTESQVFIKSSKNGLSIFKSLILSRLRSSAI